MISITILLNKDMIKNYNIYDDENKNIQMVLLQQMKHIIFLARERKKFIKTIS